MVALVVVVDTQTMLGGQVYLGRVIMGRQQPLVQVVITVVVEVLVLLLQE